MHTVALTAVDPIRDIADGEGGKTNSKQEYNLFNTQTLMQLAVLILRDAEVLEMSSLLHRFKGVQLHRLPAHGHFYGTPP